MLKGIGVNRVFNSKYYQANIQYGKIQLCPKCNTSFAFVASQYIFIRKAVNILKDVAFLSHPWVRDAGFVPPRLTDQYLLNLDTYFGNLPFPSTSDGLPRGIKMVKRRKDIFYKCSINVSAIVEGIPSSGLYGTKKSVIESFLKLKKQQDLEKIEKALESYGEHRQEVERLLATNISYILHESLPEEPSSNDINPHADTQASFLEYPELLDDDSSSQDILPLRSADIFNQRREEFTFLKNIVETKRKELLSIQEEIAKLESGLTKQQDPVANEELVNLATILGDEAYSYLVGYFGNEICEGVVKQFFYVKRVFLIEKDADKLVSIHPFIRNGRENVTTHRVWCMKYPMSSLKNIECIEHSLDEEIERREGMLKCKVSMRVML